MRAYLLFGILAVFSILQGCCLATTPSAPSGSCPYGTYGSACTSLCSSVGGDNCFTKCMDSVRSEGLGDATTCCKQSFRTQCDSTCAALETQTQGDTTKAECMSECLGNYQALNVPPDICYLPGA
jgi:hypothetical protein